MTGDPTKRPAREPGVQSVDRAVQVLAILGDRGEAGVSEVAVELDVHRSTVHRILASLEAGALVEQVEERGRYRLGFGLIPLAGAVAGRLDLVRVAHPLCIELAESMGETVNVAILDEGLAVNVDQALGPAAVSTRNWIGKRTPLHCTSSGKILLAALDDGERAAVLASADTTDHTDHTLSPEILAQELAEVADNGWALAIEEYEVGLNAAAVPIRNRHGVVVAALSVSGPAYRLDRVVLADLLPELLEAGAEISRRLGHLTPPAPSPSPGTRPGGARSA